MVVNQEYDQIIIGAGIVGISLGLAILEQNPGIKVLIIDKEDKPGVHASGRNSGVLHAGFYYSPDSLKAKFCRLGNSHLSLSHIVCTLLMSLVDILMSCFLLCFLSHCIVKFLSHPGHVAYSTCARSGFLSLCALELCTDRACLVIND